jgi:hypothetical protein
MTLLVITSGCTTVGTLLGALLGLSEGIEVGCVLVPAINNELKTGIFVVSHTAPIAPMPVGVIRFVTLFNLLVVTSALQNEPVKTAVVILVLVAAIALSTVTVVSFPNELKFYILKQRQPCAAQIKKFYYHQILAIL